MPSGLVSFSGPPSVRVTWDQVALNGGGAITGFSAANDGTIVCRPDIASSQKWTGSAWTPIGTQNQLLYPQFSGYLGIFGHTEIQIAPSDSSRIYQFVFDQWGGQRSIKWTYMYRSDNGGTSSVRTNYPANGFYEPTNNEPFLQPDFMAYKRVQNKFAIDPANPDVVFSTNPGGYPLYTTNAGESWSEITGLPSGNSGMTLRAASSTEIYAAGSGGTAGSQIVTVVGGANSTPASLNVTVSASGQITSVNSVNNAGSYTAIPMNPVSVTGGGLSDAKLMVSFSGTKLGAACWTFDPNGGTTTINGQTRTKYLYVSIEGAGTYFSNDGGVTFTQISASVGLLGPHYCALASDGSCFYVTDATGSGGTTSNVNRWVPTSPGATTGTWTNKLNTSGYTSYPGGAFSIAAHPTNPSVLVATLSTNHVPQLYFSDDKGDTFATYNITSDPLTSPQVFTSSDAPWWANQAQAITMASNRLMFDPANVNDLWLCMGQGICKTTLTLSGSPLRPSTPITWASKTTGLETAVCDDLVHESGTVLLQGMADILTFVRPTNSLSTAPANPVNMTSGSFGPSPGGNNNTQSCAIDQYNVLNMATVANQNAASAWFSGYSRDGGTSWTHFANNPGNTLSTAALGEVMISNGRIFWMSYEPFGWQYSDDWGTTWTPIGLPTGTFGSVTKVPLGGFNGGGVQGFIDNNSSPGTYSGVAGTTLTIKVVPAYGQIRVGQQLISTTNSLQQVVATNAEDGSYTGTGGLGTYKVAISEACSQRGITGFGGWGHAGSSVPGKTGCVDRVNQNKIYLYNYSSGSGYKGMFISTDRGANFTYQGASSDPYSGGISVRFLRAVPGVEGMLFAATGWNSGAAQPVSNNTFKYSTDGGANWSTVANMLSVNAFGFGKTKVTGGPATMLVAGFYKNLYGLWMSTDLGTTFAQVVSSAYGPWPSTNDGVQVIEGDKDVFGRFYVGFHGSGSRYCTLA